jgi:TRAP-type C4-dicarboxylate transport system, small permease component
MWSALDRNVEKWALLAFYSMLVVTMAVEVIRRELFSYSSVWGEEIVRYSFIYLAWIGASAAVKDRAHIRIDVLYNFMSQRGKAVLYVFSDLVMLLVSCVAFYFALEAVLTSWKFSSVTHGLRISLALFLAAVPIGFGLMVIRLIQSLLRDIRSIRDGKPVFEGATLFESDQP